MRDALGPHIDEHEHASDCVCRNISSSLSLPFTLLYAHIQASWLEMLVGDTLGRAGKFTGTFDSGRTHRAYNIFLYSRLCQEDHATDSHHHSSHIGKSSTE